MPLIVHETHPDAVQPAVPSPKAFCSIPSFAEKNAVDYIERASILQMHHVTVRFDAPCHGGEGESLSGFYVQA